MIDERKLVVVSGPSGCGKDTVVHELIKLDDDVEISVSCTTRKRRKGERNGVDYYYITREEFEQRVKNRRMLEYTEYAGNLYGTPLDEIEQRIEENKTVVLIIDVNGGMTIKTLFPHSLLIFVTPPSMKELRRRLTLRSTEDPTEIDRRMAIAVEEMKQVDFYDYAVENLDKTVCAKQIYDIIKDWQSR